MAYDFGFEHGKKYPVGWAGDPDDCSKKYSYGGFGGKDSVLLKEYAQCRLARILQLLCNSIRISIQALEMIRYQSKR
ncbi:MAG: hypothetical protein WA323_10560 [Candidatus Nitrosopolaris sp.]